MKFENVLIVIPACNEEDSIGETLRSIQESISALSHASVKVKVVVVCDSCTDRTRQMAIHEGGIIDLEVLSVGFRNVGRVRDFGARAFLSRSEPTWIAFTDADTKVQRSWLSQQLVFAEAGYDAYFGRVSFDEGNAILDEFMRKYLSQSHLRIHGANMGLSSMAFEEVGGIAHLSCHEDQALYRDMARLGKLIKVDDLPLVHTSARLEGRAPEGFASTLNDFAERRRTAL